MAASVTTTATTLEGQILELLAIANEREKLLPEETNEERVSLSFDADAGEVSASITMPCTITATAGVLEATPSTYFPNEL